MELIIKLLKIKMDFHYLTNPKQFINIIYNHLYIL
jgi:hypothetical protein